MKTIFNYMLGIYIVLTAFFLIFNCKLLILSAIDVVLLSFFDIQGYANLTSINSIDSSIIFYEPLAQFEVINLDYTEFSSIFYYLQNITSFFFTFLKSSNSHLQEVYIQLFQALPNISINKTITNNYILDKELNSLVNNEGAILNLSNVSLLFNEQQDNFWSILNFANNSNILKYLFIFEYFYVFLNFATELSFTQEMNVHFISCIITALRTAVTLLYNSNDNDVLVNAILESKITKNNDLKLNLENFSNEFKAEMESLFLSLNNSNFLSELSYIFKDKNNNILTLLPVTTEGFNTDFLNKFAITDSFGHILTPMDAFISNNLNKNNFLTFYSVNNTFFSYFLIVAVLLFFSVPIVKKMSLIPNSWQIFMEEVYKFIFNILESQVGKKAQRFFPYVFIIFIFILVANILGMTLFSFTITSHIMVTFTLGVSSFIGLTILGFFIQKLSFFNLFLPRGIPVALVPLLVVVEIISYCSRALSLSIRLFANLMSGHTLLHILAFFSSKLFKFKYIIGFLSFLLILAIVVLEFCIALLQAYVFTILICIYLNDSFSAGH